MRDEELGAALRAEMGDLRPPRGADGLAEVVRLGRRRRFVRQAGSGAAAVAVVGLAVTAAVLAGPGASQSVGPADEIPGSSASDTPGGTTPPSTTSGAARTGYPAGWAPAPLAARTPYRTWSPAETAPPPPGGPVVAVPLCSRENSEALATGSVRAGGAWQQALAAALDDVAGDAETGALVEEVSTPNHTGEITSYIYTADITDAEGTGSVRVTLERFTGTPRAAADAQAFAFQNCEPPERAVLPDGSVAQVASAVPSEPFQSWSRELRVFRPDGVLVSVSLHNFGSPDLVPDPVQRGLFQRVGPGRPTLPLTGAQLALLGEALATHR